MRNTRSRQDDNKTPRVNKVSPALREAFLRNTPSPRPGEKISEARAELLADQILEGPLGIMTSLMKTAKSAVASGGKIFNQDTMSRIIASLKLQRKAATDAQTSFAEIVGRLSDEQKPAVDKIKDAARAQVQALNKRLGPSGIKSLVDAGIPAEDATALMALIISTVSAEAQVGADTKIQ